MSQLVFSNADLSAENWFWSKVHGEEKRAFYLAALALLSPFNQNKEFLEFFHINANENRLLYLF